MWYLCDEHFKMLPGEVWVYANQPMFHTCNVCSRQADWFGGMDIRTEKLIQELKDGLSKIAPTATS